MKARFDLLAEDLEKNVPAPHHCPTCYGSGHYFHVSEKCRQCDGTGLVGVVGRDLEKGVTPEAFREMVEALRLIATGAKDALDGDSNDDEHDALYDVYGQARAALALVGRDDVAELDDDA